MSSGYNEADLSPEVKDLHRALASLQEELEAIDYYQQRMDRTGDPALKAVLEHNRNEEMEHAAMLQEWLRRRTPQFDEALRTYLFTQRPLEAIEAESEGEAASDHGRGLGLGNLRR